MTTAGAGRSPTLVDPRIDRGMARSVARRASGVRRRRDPCRGAPRSGARPEPIDAREARADRRRWWPLAAAATVAAIAVGVLQLTPPDELGAPATDTAVMSDMPAPAAEMRRRVRHRRRPRKSKHTRAATMPASAARHSRMDAQRHLHRPSCRRAAAARAAQPSRRLRVTGAPRTLRANRRTVGRNSLRPTPAAPVETKQQMAAASPPASPPDPFPAAQKPAADGAAAASGQLAASPHASPAVASGGRRQRGARTRFACARGRSAGSRATPAPSRTAERASAASAPTPQSAPLAKMAAGSAAESGADEARVKDRGAVAGPGLDRAHSPAARRRQAQPKRRRRSPRFAPRTPTTRSCCHRICATGGRRKNESAAHDVRYPRGRASPLRPASRTTRKDVAAAS